ncbi:MAG: CoA pyrophosphatase [Gammaproteobacteria bacterium]|jgi:8-oxo-dGTP pyrophosphatase MutT (NUDIX family)|nr:CoA pyrophosphatase [Gammaproteobacteria bacterium]MDP7455245.1 CoA pyrophosphatase [Gammaproteobacteria bacterium]|tara:strand:- start:3299 stop:3970 length:672 start_codon:yes stop_codon:yes gene_type:complete
METRKSKFSDPILQRLVDYLCATQTGDRKSISHADSSINELVREVAAPLRKAAVLIPVTRSGPNTASQIVLTVRSENLKSHAGQISLPGGTREDHDSDDIETALRESEEEIGLKPEDVEVLGQLGEIAVPSGFCVTPIIGLVDSGLSLTPCPIEVAAIFQVPLELLLNPASYSSSMMTFNQIPRKILELTYGEYRIWGVTAAILYHLAREVESFKQDSCEQKE